MSIGRGLLAGAVAGAAGTTALNAVTYLDMAIRGRPWVSDAIPHLAYGAVTAWALQLMND
jgi:hypothetical protein